MTRENESPDTANNFLKNENIVSPAAISKVVQVNFSALEQAIRTTGAHNFLIHIFSSSRFDSFSHCSAIVFDDDKWQVFFSTAKICYSHLCENSSPFAELPETIRAMKVESNWDIFAWDLFPHNAVRSSHRCPFSDCREKKWQRDG